MGCHSKGDRRVDSNLPYTFINPFLTTPTYKDTNNNSQFQIYCEHFIIQHLIRIQQQYIISVQHQSIILIHDQIITNK
jgi:hypothetical protein